MDDQNDALRRNLPPVVCIIGVALLAYGLADWGSGPVTRVQLMGLQPTSGYSTEARGQIAVGAGLLALGVIWMLRNREAR